MPKLVALRLGEVVEGNHQHGILLLHLAEHVVYGMLWVLVAPLDDATGADADIVAVVRVIPATLRSRDDGHDLLSFGR